MTSQSGSQGQLRRSINAAGARNRFRWWASATGRAFRAIGGVIAGGLSLDERDLAPRARVTHEQGRPDAQPFRALSSRSTISCVTPSTGTRSCAIESRSRTVTAPSSSESTSTVMHHGVPISSWRR